MIGLDVFPYRFCVQITEGTQEKGVSSHSKRSSLSDEIWTWIRPRRDLINRFSIVRSLRILEIWSDRLEELAPAAFVRCDERVASDRALRDFSDKEYDANEMWKVQHWLGTYAQYYVIESTGNYRQIK